MGWRVERSCAEVCLERLRGSTLTWQCRQMVTRADASSLDGQHAPAVNNHYLPVPRGAYGRCDIAEGIRRAQVIRSKIRNYRSRVNRGIQSRQCLRRLILDSAHRVHIILI